MNVFNESLMLHRIREGRCRELGELYQLESSISGQAPFTQGCDSEYYRYSRPVGNHIDRMTHAFILDQAKRNLEVLGDAIFVMSTGDVNTAKLKDRKEEGWVTRFPFLPMWCEFVHGNRDRSCCLIFSTTPNLSSMGLPYALVVWDYVGGALSGPVVAHMTSSLTQASNCAAFVPRYKEERQIECWEKVASSLGNACAGTLELLVRLNCINVRTEPCAYIVKKAKKKRRRIIRPAKKVIARTLVVRNSKKQIVYDSAAQASQEPSMRMHTVHGHARIYTKERPLFGKYAGQFWIPDHVRGSTAIGLVEKDYELSSLTRRL